MLTKMTYLPFAFFILLAASMGHSTEAAASKELTKSILHLVQFLQGWLRKKIEIFIANDGKFMTLFIKEIDEVIENKKIMIDNLKKALEEGKANFNSVPVWKFKNFKKGQEHFYLWYKKGEAMLHKSTPCVTKIETQWEEWHRMKSTSDASFIRFQQLHDDLEACVINDGIFGSLNSLFCTLRMTFRVLWETSGLPKIPVYDAVFYKLQDLMPLASCLTSDLPTSVELNSISGYRHFIVNEAKVAM